MSGCMNKFIHSLNVGLVSFHSWVPGLPVQSRVDLAESLLLDVQLNYFTLGLVLFLEVICHSVSRTISLFNV